MDELYAMLPHNPKKRIQECELCDYKNSRRENLAKHVALFHCKLDELMADSELVKKKREQVQNKPKKLPMGDMCVICGTISPSREHVATKHFMKELMEIVSAFDNPLVCELGRDRYAPGHNHISEDSSVKIQDFANLKTFFLIMSKT